MELTENPYERIAPLLPKQRGNVGMSNPQVLNAILYAAEHGCKRRKGVERLFRCLNGFRRIFLRF